MSMMEMPIEYLNKLASQFIFISAFFGGFSASILGTLIISKSERKIVKYLILGSSLSSIAFIVSVFAMTKLVMVSTPGYPFDIEQISILYPRIVGIIAFMVGILSLIFVISLSGWMHSKRLGIATTSIGVVGFILFLTVA
ncbi:MAG: hypothetical protein AAFQ94_12490 [Bacteroidota bacterium]